MQKTRKTAGRYFAVLLAAVLVIAGAVSSYANSYEEWVDDKTTVKGLPSWVKTTAAKTTYSTGTFWRTGSIYVNIYDGNNTRTYTIDSSFHSSKLTIDNHDDSARRIDLSISEKGSGAVTAKLRPASGKECYTNTRNTFCDQSAVDGDYDYMHIPLSVTVPEGYQFDSCVYMDRKKNNNGGTLLLASTTGSIAEGNPPTHAGLFNKGGGGSFNLDLGVNLTNAGHRTKYNCRHTKTGYNIAFRNTRLTLSYNANGGTRFVNNSEEASGFRGTKGENIKDQAVKTYSGDSSLRSMAETFAENGLANSGIDSGTGEDAGWLAMTKPGYHTNGKWIPGSPDGGVRIEDDRVFPTVLDLSKALGSSIAASDRTAVLYADYDPNTLKIRFDKNNEEAEGEMDDEELIYGVKEQLDPNRFSSARHRFLGWNTEADGSGTTYEDRQSMTGMLVDYSYDNELTLYAQWELENDNFSAASDAEPQGLEFDEIFPQDGNAALEEELKTGQWFMITGLDAGIGSRIKEKGIQNYKPSFKVSDNQNVRKAKDSSEAGSDLSSADEILSCNTAYDYTNEFSEPETVELSLSKFLAGDLINDDDRAKRFTFSMKLSGLDDEALYSYFYTSDPDHPTNFTSENGRYDDTLSLRGGEKVILTGLPAGTGYTFTETNAEGFDSHYKITDESGTADAAEGNSSSGTLTAGPGFLTAGYDVDVSFVNSKYGHHDLTLKKRVMEDGQQRTDSEEFDFTVKITDLEPDTAYVYTKYHSDGTSSEDKSFTADSSGNSSIDGIKLKAEEYIVFHDLAGSAGIDVTEGENDYQASYEFSGPGAEGLFRDQTDVRESGFEAAFTGLEGDVTLTAVNTHNTKADLKIAKRFKGEFTELMEPSGFVITFEGLEQDTEYERTGASGTGMIRSDHEGKYTGSFWLDDGQTIAFKGLPEKCRYVIAETGEEDVTAEYAITEGEEKALIKSGSGEKGRELRTPEEVLHHDRTYLFENTGVQKDPDKEVRDEDEDWSNENHGKNLAASWEYRVTQNVKCPVRSFAVSDDLPANVAALLKGDEDNGIAEATFSWTEPGGTEHTGSISQEEEDHYSVKEGNRTLFRVYADDAEEAAGSIEVEAADHSLLELTGEAVFEMRFNARLATGTSEEDLISSGQQTDTGEFRFRNEAYTLINGVDHRSEPANTILEVHKGLTVKKHVRTEYETDRTAAFDFKAEFSGLKPGKDYSCSTPDRITVSFSCDGNRVNIKALDENGEPRSNVKAVMIDDENDTVGTVRTGRNETIVLDEGRYTAMISYNGGTSIQTDLELTKDDGWSLSSYPATIIGYRHTFFTADRDGRKTVYFKLADKGQVSFTDLETGAAYEITELAAKDYRAVFEVTAGREITVLDAGAADMKNTALSSGENIFSPIVPVTIEYTNEKTKTEAGITKEYEGDPSLFGSKFTLTRDDGESISWISPLGEKQVKLETGYTYTLSEDEAPDRYDRIKDINFRVLADGRIPESDLTNEHITGFVRDAEGIYHIRIKDRKTDGEYRDIVLAKNVTGNLGDKTKKFRFDVILEHLDTDSDYKLSGAEERSIRSDAEGKAEFTVYLKDDERVRIRNLPEGARYTVTEAASDHVASYSLKADADESLIANASGTNGRRSGMPLSTGTETVEAADGTIVILYENNRDLAAVTGMSNYLRIWMAAMMILIASVLFRIVARRTKIGFVSRRS